LPTELLGVSVLLLELVAEVAREVGRQHLRGFVNFRNIIMFAAFCLPDISASDA